MSKQEQCECCRDRKTTCGDCGTEYLMVDPSTVGKGAGALWKQRFDMLKIELADLVMMAERGVYEKSENRAWDPEPEIFVSFGCDVVGVEEKAIEMFGAGKYDVYRLERKENE